MMLSNLYKPRRQPKIFISYRRDDSEAYTDFLYEQLAPHFGREHVFVDVDNIPVGQDFVEVITEAVTSCDILLAVIGRQWLTVGDGRGRRLDNPEDFVRLEIGTALRSRIQVVPVLVQGASMPSAQDLPDELKGLARRHAFQISREHRHEDMDRLVRALRESLAGERPHAKSVPAARASAGRQASSRRKLFAVLGIAALCSAAVLAWWAFGRTHTPPSGGAASAAPTATPQPSPTAAQTLATQDVSNVSTTPAASPTAIPAVRSPTRQRRQRRAPSAETLSAEEARRRREAALRALDQ